MSRKPRVRFCLLCDDVREEKSGKYVLVGLYPDGFSIPRGSARVRLALVASIAPPGAGTFKILFRIKYADRIESQIEGFLEAENDRPTLAPMTFELTDLSVSSDIKVDASSDGKSWVNVLTAPIVVTDAPQ